MGNAVHYHSDQRNDAKGLIEKHHYSGIMPQSAVIIGTMHEDGGLFGDHGPAVAACVFGIPATSGWPEPVLELSRLVRLPNTKIALTGLISWTMNRCRVRGYDLAISYADPTQGHHGGIYQAASWFYAHQNDSACDGFMIDGEFVHRRSCNSRWGTSSLDKLQALLRKPITRHRDAGKHLYFKPLNRQGRAKAKRLGLAAQPYPKPDFVESFP